MGIPLSYGRGSCRSLLAKSLNQARDRLVAVAGSFRMSARVSACLLTALVLILVTDVGRAQILDASWTEAAAKRIDKHRKTDLRIIVLNKKSDPVAKTQVRIRQIDHAFRIGFVAPATGWPELFNEDAPGWRVFNAVSLDRLSDWPKLQPDGPTQWQGEALDSIIQKAHSRVMTRHWGGVVSADLGRHPAWVADKSGASLRDALLDYASQRVVKRYRDRVRAFDLFTHWLSHDLTGRGLAMPFVRRLFQHVRADAPGTRLAVRFTDSLIGQRHTAMLNKTRAMREAFIRYDRVTIDHTFRRMWSHGPLRQALTDLTSMQRPVTLTGLRIAGPSEADAAILMETVLRLAFAEPSIRGIYFDGLLPGTAAEADTALFDKRGELTEVGEVVDGLFHGRWRTDERRETDPLGNVRARVFPGRYRISATIDGKQHATRLWLPRDTEERIVVLQPTVGDNQSNTE